MRASDRVSPELRSQILALPPAAIAELYCERVRQDRGDRELRIAFRDGRYDRSHVKVRLSDAD